MVQDTVASITWQGLPYAAAGQAAVVAAVSAALQVPRRQLTRALIYCLFADLLLAPVLFAIGASSRRLAHGPQSEWATIVLPHCGLAMAAAWLVWRKAMALSLSTRPSRAAGLLLIATVLGSLLPGMRCAQLGAPAQLTHTVVRLRRLPTQLDGLRIVLISDLHIGPYMPVAEARRLLDPLRDVRADLTVFAGDLVSEEPGSIEAAACLLEEVAPRGMHFAVLGNHDHWTSAEVVTDALRAHRFRVLANERLRVMLRGARVWIAGVDDASTGYARPVDALRGTSGPDLVILLSHTPDIVADGATRPVDLVLCGHTHGGQVVLPLFGPMMDNSKYGLRHLAGLSRFDRGFVFTTRGLGYVMLPVRVFCEPEISVLELRTPPTA